MDRIRARCQVVIDYLRDDIVTLTAEANQAAKTIAARTKAAADEDSLQVMLRGLQVDRTRERAFDALLSSVQAETLTTTLVQFCAALGHAYKRDPRTGQTVCRHCGASEGVSPAPVPENTDDSPHLRCQAVINDLRSRNLEATADAWYEKINLTLHCAQEDIYECLMRGLADPRTFTWSVDAIKAIASSDATAHICELFCTALGHEFAKGDTVRRCTVCGVLEGEEPDLEFEELDDPE